MTTSPETTVVPIPRWALEYWRKSRQPLASLAFVIPLLLIYEGGVLVLGSAAVRNGADQWLRQLLDMLGLSHYFLLPVLIVCALLAWHHVVRDPWRVSVGVIYVMYLECLLLALVLLGLGRLQGSVMQDIRGAHTPTTRAMDDAANENSITSTAPECRWPMFGNRFDWVGKLVGYFGAGIYEEVLFRLLLLPAVAGALHWAGIATPLRTIVAVVVTSLVFSAAHYLGPQGDALHPFTFIFRFLAGGFFAVLFVYRGFGIAAGTHAVYDILVGLFY